MKAVTRLYLYYLKDKNLNETDVTLVEEIISDAYKTWAQFDDDLKVFKFSMPHLLLISTKL